MGQVCFQTCLLYNGTDVHAWAVGAYSDHLSMSWRQHAARARLRKGNADNALEFTVEQAAFLEKLNPGFWERNLESSARRDFEGGETYAQPAFTATREISH